MSDLKAQMEVLDFSGDGKVMILRIPKGYPTYSDADVQDLLQTVDQISKDMKVKIPVLVLPQDIGATSLSKEEVKTLLSTLEK